MHIRSSGQHHDGHWNSSANDEGYDPPVGMVGRKIEVLCVDTAQGKSSTLSGLALDGRPSDAQVTYSTMVIMRKRPMKFVLREPVL